MTHKGLSTKEVFEYQEKYGLNILPYKEVSSPLSIFFSQFKSVFMYILFFTLCISLLFHEYVDAILILAVIILNVCIGFYQEHRTYKILDSLKNLISTHCTVIRDGKRYRLESKDLVKNDLVVLSTGDKVPADGTLIEGVDVFAREAILTGEEEAIPKKPPLDQLYMGTFVVSGRCIIKVTQIGKNTKIGQIGISLGEIKSQKTPIQKELDHLAQKLTYLIIAISIGMIIFSFFQGMNLSEAIRTSVVLSIAIIPEGLNIAVTVILSVGMKRILKKHGLVKQLISVETLGATTVICTDKTGTLTEGVMKVVEHDFSDDQKAFQVLALTNERKSNIEISIWEFLERYYKKNLNTLMNTAHRIYEEPFKSDKKYTMTVNKVQSGEIACLVGASDIVLYFCDLPETQLSSIKDKIEEWSVRGLKVLGVCYKDIGDLREKKNFIFLGLIGIEDPPREKIQEVISKAQKAGIGIKIITGDYRHTAEKITKHLGFTLAPNEIIEGKEIDTFSRTQMKKVVQSAILFCRVTPHHKLRIIEALQANGEVVAMTGDGVNDAQALKKADIGIVMGDSADTAKEVGDLILLDNNFKTIVDACEEGRLIYENIKKVISYILSNSFIEVIIIFGSMILKLPLPLTIMQILWLHLICDGPPDIVLGFEPKQRDLMQEKPRNVKKDHIFDKKTLFLIIVISFISGTLILLYLKFIYSTTQSIELVRTIIFASVGSVNLIYIISFKDLKTPVIFMKNFWENKWIVLALFYGFILLFSAIYIPPLQKLLGTTSLDLHYYILVFGVGILTTIFLEFIKIITLRNEVVNKVHAR